MMCTGQAADRVGKLRRQRDIFAKLAIWPEMTDMRDLARSEGIRLTTMSSILNNADTRNCLVAQQGNSYFFGDEESKIRTLRFMDSKIHENGGEENGR